MTTDRLRLREPETHDAESLRDYYRRNAERFAPWEPPHADEVAWHARWVDETAERRRAGSGASFLAFAASGDLVGVVQLSGFSEEEPRTAMLSYTVDGEYEGRGYASEAVGRIVQYAFEELGLAALLAYYHPDNARSEALLQRLGFSVVARSPVIPGFEHLMRPQVVAERRAVKTSA